MFIFAALNLLILICSVNSIDIDFITPLKDNLKFHNPTIISKRNSNFQQQIFKTFSKQNEYITIKNSSLSLKNSDLFRNVIMISNSSEETVIELECLKKFQAKIIVLQDHIPFENVFLKRLDLNINHEIYFFMKSTKEVLESFKINGVHIKRSIGKLIGTQFKWHENVETDFVKRRSNFYGLSLKAYTEASARDIVFDTRFKERAPFSEASQTYLVNDFTSGLHYDILKLMESNLNFTTHLMKTKDQNWGYIKDTNGTIHGEGMIYQMYQKKADFILSNIAMTPERYFMIPHLF